MKISNTSLPGVGGANPVQEATRVEGPSAAATSHSSSSASPSPLQSAALTPAMTSMRDMPEIDQAKVEAVRDALAKGEIKFDAKKLAGLIERYHGGRS